MSEKPTFDQPCANNVEGNLETGNEQKKLEIQRELVHSLEAIRQAKLFDEGYLDGLTLVAFGERQDSTCDYVFKDGKITAAPHGQYDKMDFMRGRRVDFAGISSKEDFDFYMARALREKTHIELIFLEDAMTYDEFVTHEVAHNIFDREYTKRIGPYIDHEKVTDVSEEFREKVRGIIIPLVRKYFPKVETNRFIFKRQQIAEIFAMMYEREFCQRSGQSFDLHKTIEKKVARFFEDPEKILAEYNHEHGTDYSMETVYEENHILSIIVTPILEKEFPDWEERKDIFWK